ncbi:MAG: hypothetical protein QOG47_631 [Mycobacterium sp.]|nr:hypothetical protein [Mycobacterium sp.]
MSKGSIGSYGSNRLLRLVGRARRACGSRRISRGGRPRRSGSRGCRLLLLRRGGSDSSKSRVGRRRAVRSRGDSAASSIGGRGRRVRDDGAGRLPVLRSAALDRADRATACSRRARGRVARSGFSASADVRCKSAVNLASSPSGPPSVLTSPAASPASETSASLDPNRPRYQRTSPTSRTPADVSSISGKRSIKG